MPAVPMCSAQGMEIRQACEGDEEDQMGVGDGMRQNVEVICEDLVERILLRLPLSSCIKFASLSKRCYSFITSPAFAERSIAGTLPFLFVWGLHPATLHTPSCMYDPIAGRWFTLNLTNDMPSLSSLARAFALTSTPFGTLILYSTLPSSHGVHLRFALNPANTNWSISLAPRRCFDSSPIVAAFDTGSPPSSPSFEVFVLGELCKSPSVQLYNSTSNSWEVCRSFPTFGPGDGFLGSYHVSSAILGRKVYLANILSGTIACFDMDSRLWSPPSKLQAPAARRFLISSTIRGLYALALCAADEAEECAKLFKVDLATMTCQEVSEMPHHLWSFLIDRDPHSILAFRYLRCIGGGYLVYVYNGSYFNRLRVCVCDISAGYGWHQIPDLPDALQHLGIRAECCSFQLLPSVFLKSWFEQ